MDPERISDFHISDLVISKAGRDMGKLFYVVGIENEFLLLANGKDRPLDRPKRKKRKHVQQVLRPETRVAEKLRHGDKVLNGELRRDWAFLAKDASDNLGG